MKGAATGRWEHAGEGGILVGKGRDQGKDTNRRKGGSLRVGISQQTLKGKVSGRQGPPKSKGNNSTREVNMLWDRRQH